MRQYGDIFREPQAIKETLAKVIAETKVNDVVLICGSFFIMAEVRAALNI